MTAPVIEADRLQVIFGCGKKPVDALRDVTLSLAPGSLFVLLGPNGAGKTTLMRCVTGSVKASGGTLNVFGNPAGMGDASRSWLRRMGVLIENPGVYGRLDAREYLVFFGSFYGVPDLHLRIRYLCGELGLELDGKPVAKLSQGNRQKLQLARSLLHRPELLLWDEPTDHLDPVSQKEALEYLGRYLRETGAAALVATHRLEQMSEAATHFGFLRQGKLLRTGTQREILGSDAESVQARVGFAAPVKTEDLTWLEGAFQVAISVDSADMPATEIVLTGPGMSGKLPGLVKAICLRDYPVSSVTSIKSGLSEVYAEIMGT